MNEKENKITNEIMTLDELKEKGYINDLYDKKVIGSLLKSNDIEDLGEYFSEEEYQEIGLNISDLYGEESSSESSIDSFWERRFKGVLTNKEMKEMIDKDINDCFDDVRQNYAGNLYAFYYGGYDGFQEVKKFLDSVLPKESNWYGNMFKEGQHPPIIGIYDKENNRLLSVGIGRKNRTFHHCTDPSLKKHLIEQESWGYFSDNDVLGLVTLIMDSIEEASGLHSVCGEDSPEEDDYEDDEAYEEEYEEWESHQDEILDSLVEEMESLAIMIPHLPDSMGDISPCNF